MRKAKYERKTKETDVEVQIVLEGTGEAEVETGIDFFDHLLESMAKHGNFDLTAKGKGDFEHHIAEDVTIALGKCFEKALGDKKGIRRMGDAVVPMDDSLVLVALDLGGREYSDIDVTFEKEKIVDLTSDLFVHLLETLSSNLKCNLHVDVLRGANDHHKAEATFKALGVALSEAVEKIGEEIPSRKGMI
ncbi:hypothetical protein AKJ50_01615 [candidate division MSBL1 archaeon SCGC-AAA382A13]|uniref:Imidazoleglycerol-phosphate dehydratase n=2 Tax=candidate division MSBL1 TaxID=215777 RepID=A0A133VGZ9_9EURY|nr:hypothetical protein AKJ50_01615 [candidate division MSBL1 archaeon SCGC-AAA382A13]KXB05705.1 hypothetical protein AKJ49_00270 [candidate division MSBL1 archaeon SCGC-AAA382A03]